jgi:phosphoheptose isomerase
MSERAGFVREYLSASIDVQRRMADTVDAIAAAADALVRCFSAGNKLLLCGNGGSAADCQHVAAELVSRLTRDFERPGLPAIALTTDTSFLTAFANDVEFDGIFERQVRALGRPGDALLAISTSGGSANVLRAVHAAVELGMVTIGLSGDGGQLEDLVDHAVVVPSRETQHVQEALLPVEHALCHLVESALFRRDPEP